MYWAGGEGGEQEKTLCKLVHSIFVSSCDTHLQQILQRIFGVKFEKKKYFAEGANFRFSAMRDINP